jgi:hypothetical protein
VLTEMLDILRNVPSDGFRHEQVTAYGLGERFHAAGLVDGGADDREIRAIRSADVAKKDRTFVEDDARPQQVAAFGVGRNTNSPIPNHGADRVSRAALDRALKHLGGGTVTKVRAQRVFGNLQLAMPLHMQGE